MALNPGYEVAGGCLTETLLVLSRVGGVILIASAVYYFVEDNWLDDLSFYCEIVALSKVYFDSSFYLASSVYCSIFTGCLVAAAFITLFFGDYEFVFGPGDSIACFFETVDFVDFVGEDSVRPLPPFR